MCGSVGVGVVCGFQFNFFYGWYSMIPCMDWGRGMLNLVKPVSKIGAL